MSADGRSHDQTHAFSGYDSRVADRFWAMASDTASMIGAEFQGMDLVPEGGALFVSNHAFGWDVMLPMAAIRKATGRRVWALGEHLW